MLKSLESIYFMTHAKYNSLNFYRPHLLKKGFITPCPAARIVWGSLDLTPYSLFKHGFQFFQVGSVLGVCRRHTCYRGNTALSRYIAVIFIGRFHERRPITRPWGRSMGCCSWMQSVTEVQSCNCCCVCITVLQMTAIYRVYSIYIYILYIYTHINWCVALW